MSNLVPIKALFDFEKGQLQSSKNTAGEYTFITASSEWKTHESFTHDCEALIFAMAASGSLGRTHYFNGKFIASDLCFILTPKEKYKNQIDLKFYYTIFNDLREEIVKQTATGTSKISINRENFGNYEIPFFDKDHQEQVRTKLDAVHPIKDGLSSELQTQSNLIAKLRASILSDAVSGRLVPQDTNDEPASILLKRIQVTREQWIQKEKKLDNQEAVTIERKIEKLRKNPQNSPAVNVPQNWIWSTILEASNLVVDCHNKTAPYTDSGIWIIRTTNVKNGVLNTNEQKFVNQDTYNYWSKRCPPAPGDIVYTREAPVGEVAIIPANTQICLGQRMMLIRPFHEYLLKEYLRIVLMGAEFLKRLEGVHIGATVKHLRVGDVENAMIPIPPLAEQYRIVAKVEQLMATCDALEAEVAKSRTETDRLMQTILKEAFR